MRPLARQCDRKYGFIREPLESDFELDFTTDCKPFDSVECKVTAVARPMQDGITAITVMVVNTAKSKGQAEQRKMIFQPKLTIYSREGYHFVDNSFMNERFIAQDSEELRLAMLYQDKKSYASGLGSAADWDIKEDGSGTITNTFIPEHELQSMDFGLDKNIDEYEREILSMKYHSDLDKTPIEDKVGYLQQLLDAYKQWIFDRKQEIEKMPQKFHAVAKENMADCEDSLLRMQKGLQILSENKNVQIAFSLANRAMFMQRIHLAGQQKLSEEKTRFAGDEKVQAWLNEIDYTKCDDENTKWRPFQIAFLLMSIPGIVDEKSEDRKLVDLIWFPTGGGKTEAYLGLAAFVIFYRRLAYPQDYGGTNIIMRYTLRLLTAQQFNRASTLICACELIRQQFNKGTGRGSARQRRKNNGVSNITLGDERITIGIWIGSAHTPNKNDDAIRKSKKLKRGEGKNVFQVIKCPWCGTSMVADYKHKEWGYCDQNNQFFFSCPQEGCAFNQAHIDYALPIQVVDEMLYKKPPTLLIGTIDKFAMMAWNDKVKNFFAGRGPELIIQDELHLISGPLGSMAGLYETAVDYICHKNGHMPKIIASTATIRRAREQCSALYNRDMRQFPAPGLKAGNSYFAREKDIDYAKGSYGRRYVGLMASGKNKASMQILLLANILEAGKSLELPSADIRDLIWTVVGYFGSIKDLGACKKYADEDIPGEIPKIAQRLGKAWRECYQVKELTSRVDTEQLNHILDRLEKTKYQDYDKSVKEQGRIYPVDLVLSTNMISVGIDVSRLNVMAMIGQPKLTSEYIQASSRVGRSGPGTVFVMYDAARSRDRSYYEQFRYFHDTIYRHVEPTGATPFSAPARDRALHAVIVSIMRATTDLNSDAKANKFSTEKYSKDIDEIKNYILQRFQEIRVRNGSKIQDVSNDISKEMQGFFDEWEKLVECEEIYGVNLSYGDEFMRRGYTEENRNEKRIRLMHPFGQSETSGYSSKPTMTSMRNVDCSIPGTLMSWRKK